MTALNNANALDEGQTLNNAGFDICEGSVAPFGATLNESGCNFSIYCPDAEQVFLCLFSEDDQELARFKLHQRIQSKWFCCIKGVKEGQKYAYRVRPKVHRRVNDEMDEGRLLIDPYATQISKALHWDREAYNGSDALINSNTVKDNSAFVPKSIVRQKTATTNSITNYAKRVLQASDRIIYEAHVKGISQLHPSVPSEQRGTYLGASHPDIIEHLVSLGVTTVQFMPIFAFMPEPYISEKGLTNYWGYNPINFFSPEVRYAQTDAVNECKQMIERYHAAGLEVVLDVVYNHTCESGEPGCILSFKGLCHQHAYLQVSNDELSHPSYLNYSGCGNTINTADTFMQTMIIDSLRYWVVEMGVDGFRFDLAASLGREPVDFHANAAFFKILRQDPVLKDAIMIAEPWDIGPGGYQLGHFPDYWLEVNDRFRDDVRGFWRSDKGLKADFATRFMGSKDFFPKGVRPMQASINNVTYHDGFTLHDLVSYAHKHNFANLEDNRDGHNHNLSANYGVEGETDDIKVIALREQQKRNLFATLVLSQGTPHILGGDELSRSQKGNNNAYCQDNELNWFNWELTSTQRQFLAFTRHVLALRKQHKILSRMMFADDKFTSEVNIASTQWYRVDGSHKRDQDWTNDNHHCFALHLVAIANQSTDETEDGQEWLYCVNGSADDVEFNLPLLLNDVEWECMLHTACERIDDYQSLPISPLFKMPARCLSLFRKR
ncbi:glycogen debranching protein GlgX [Glaciecola sp. MH2013]|uniref:glycogen debranching protein GlgX n=1 Tax=Glaciecola sp. MH2013 TaxID=2785524 RepID=UPI00189EFD17|nr:glycogen debranching protein GlgX [Glaciecola sp. MH2013]MBF7072604.1 glycogen debranching protein GlgX [Glaciecola sp. MH2013]